MTRRDVISNAPNSTGRVVQEVLSEMNARAREPRRSHRNRRHSEAPQQLHASFVRRPRRVLPLAPTGLSWLNMADSFFAEIAYRPVKRGLHRSEHLLEQAILYRLPQLGPLRLNRRGLNRISITDFKDSPAGWSVPGFLSEFYHPTLQPESFISIRHDSLSLQPLSFELLNDSAMVIRVWVTYVLSTAG